MTYKGFMVLFGNILSKFQASEELKVGWMLHIVRCWNMVLEIFKGGLISESFSPLSCPGKNVPSHYPKLFNKKWKSLGQWFCTFFDEETIKKTMSD